MEVLPTGPGCAERDFLRVLFDTRDLLSARWEAKMRDQIRMISTAGTGHFYVTKKNQKTATEKLVLRKYDPRARKHVEYKEAKMK